MLPAVPLLPPHTHSAPSLGWLRPVPPAGSKAFGRRTQGVLAEESTGGVSSGPQGKGQPHSSLELQPRVQLPAGPCAPQAQPPQESVRISGASNEGPQLLLNP